ncbi:outer membrane beta-barrel protein [Pseudoalteromonas luteoviolacea]|uniref:Outer membrane protein beta-barrel domain-containing protein n=1 Tax=Pseudoalteromonas luteoviolacea S4054 TaxID=1129367 RepID=A0A0F6A9Y2_9GAMM|nr:outer membrane beta-barrel protein [Pseudoalteromonas luteoviolacea]AOT11116.1 hypothetical protein S4054249_25115 [Pseudoalteromonas luteoviolacea]AOT15720.1 hypothetical protein S40542_23395 [Pseudoalteromonas luteoviolacea]AOT20937.1 hypothetical protein S4054_25035 [Pseudoalteromonas luteoviolacea]KKE82219.1 hypothetical protein N479_19165 [Pseudoalteromonas luteoviolacea S4054]KZN65449.1 hypothetical protein N481_25170 [Pseudoalteromonas luteoviolacea S4047-1]
MKLISLALSGALLSATAHANDNFNFDYIGAGHAKFKMEAVDTDISLKGYAVEGSKQVDENWVVSAQYLKTSDEHSYNTVDESENTVSLKILDEDSDATQWNVNAAYLIPLEENALLEFKGSIGRLDYKQTGIQYDRVFSTNDADMLGNLLQYSVQGHSSVFGVEANYHINLHGNFTAMTGIGYQHIKNAAEKDELVIKFELQYQVTENVALSARYENFDVYENHFVTLRYRF